MEAIKQAVLALDSHKDSDWTEDGRPSLKRVRQLAKNTEITQADLDAAVPDLRRTVIEERKAKPVKVEVTATRPEGARDPGAPVDDVRMVAIEKGFYGGKIREPGESFMFTGIPGAWMRAETNEEAKYRKAQAEALASGQPLPGGWAHEVSKPFI